MHTFRRGNGFDSLNPSEIGPPVNAGTPVEASIQHSKRIDQDPDNTFAAIGEQEKFARRLPHDVVAIEE